MVAQGIWHHNSWVRLGGQSRPKPSGLTLESIEDWWSQLEADFQSEYGVSNPLDLTWRKFLTLVRGLGHESRFIRAVQMSDPRRMLDLALGREPGARKRRVQLEEFMGGI